MSFPDRELESLVSALVEALAAFAYAIGGSLALNIHATPRSTLDIDVNVFVPPERVDDVLAALATVDPLDPDALEDARSAGRVDGQFRVRLFGIRVCVFLAPAPDLFDDIRDHHRVAIGEPPKRRFYLDASALTLFKLVFGRTKDLADLQQLFAGPATIDEPWIEGWLTQIYGADNDRRLMLEELRGFRPPAR